MTVSNLILVVDDDAAIRDSLSKELHAAGYATATATDGREGVAAFETRAPDLVLTDLAMPRSDGFELIAAIRAASRTPIIVLSVRGADADKVRALDLGADDFVTKPFSVAELLARVRAQLRRTGATVPASLNFDDLIIDIERRRVVQGDARSGSRPPSSRCSSCSPPTPASRCSSIRSSRASGAMPPAPPPTRCACT